MLRYESVQYSPKPRESRCLALRAADLLTVSGYLRVLKHASACLAAEASFVDVLNEKRRGAELFAQGGVQVCEYAQTGVESDKIYHLKGPHRMVEPEF